MSSLPPLCQSGSFPTFKMCLPPPGNSPLQPPLAMPCGFQHAAGLLGVSALQSFHKLKHFSSRRFWSLAGRDHGSVFFVLTVPCAGLRTHECYTQKMLTDGLIQGTGPMPLFSLVVTGHGKAWQPFQPSSCSSQLFCRSTHSMLAWSCHHPTSVWPDHSVLAGPTPSRAPYPRTLSKSSALLCTPFQAISECCVMFWLIFQKSWKDRAAMIIHGHVVAAYYTLLGLHIDLKEEESVEIFTRRFQSFPGAFYYSEWRHKYPQRGAVTEKVWLWCQTCHWVCYLIS